MNFSDTVVSFLIPNRGGKDLPIVINNINTVYAKLNKEIIVIQQEDDLPFMRGQLYNIGVKFCTGAFVALTDNDIYHLRELPLIHLYSIFKRPLICFKYISQITLKNNKPVITKNQLMLNGMGAFNFMKKTDFIRANGFSNLYIGWGNEDWEFMRRFNNQYIRIPQNLGHLTHPWRANLNPKNTELNRKLFREFSNRDFTKDGIKQTTYNLISDEMHDTHRTIKVSGISTTPGFEYQSIIEEHFKLCSR